MNNFEIARVRDKREFDVAIGSTVLIDVLVFVYSKHLCSSFNYIYEHLLAYLKRQSSPEQTGTMLDIN